MLKNVKQIIELDETELLSARKIEDIIRELQHPDRMAITKPMEPIDMELFDPNK